MAVLDRCSGCPWNTKLCGTRGPEDSSFVIIAESPGSQELASGKPFSGLTGKVVARILSELGFYDLGIEPYIIHAHDCYPAVKNLKNLEQATRACNERVKEQLGRHPRKLILAMGLAASWAATGDFSIRITKDRGTVRKSPYASKGAVLTYHPAFIMRNGSALGVWRKDISQAIKLLKGENLVKWKDPTWSVVEDGEAYSKLVDQYIEAGGLVTGDLETSHLHWMRGEVLCHGFTRGDGSHVDIVPEHVLNAHPEITKRLMESSRITWNWANGLFDIKWFRYHWNITARCDEDIMLMSYTMNENRGFHDVDQIAQRWIGAPRHKDVMSKYYKMPPHYSLRNAPLEELYEYCAKDISKTHCSWFPMREAIRADWNHINEYRTILIPAVDFIASMQLYGVLADTGKIEQNIVEHEKELLEIRAKMNVYAQRHLGHDINPNSPPQVKSLLYEKMGLGHPSMKTNEQTLIQVGRKHEHEIIALLLDHREVAKRKGTYVSNILPDPTRKKNPQGFIQCDGRVHADYKLHGTATGRLAGSDPNMLNQPRGPLIRSQFVAGPGKIFCEVDLNQAELRSLALMSGDPILIDIYTKNEVSIHDVTTSAFFASKEDILNNPGIADTVRTQLGVHGDYPLERIYGEAKMRGKAVNFGIVYGREAYSLSREFDISMAEAQRWIDDWLDLYSGAADFIDYCRRAPLENRTLITVYGRKKRPGAVGRDTLKNLQNEFANFPHQSTASDIMLESAIEVAPVLRSKWDAHIWNELYDAIYFECDASDDLLQEAVPYIQSVITRIPKERGLLRVPFLGDAKIGYTWGAMKDYDPTKDTIKELLGPRTQNL